MGLSTDIDIDVPDRDAVLRLLEHVPATKIEGRRLSRHNSGVYFHRAPQDPLTGLCSIDYKEAEARGYFKIDILVNHAYAGVRDEEHLVDLMNREPPWELLEVREFVEGYGLFQISGHAGLLREMKPRSIEQLAMIIAMIRPAKQHLRGRPWGEIARDIWIKPTDPYLARGFFEKAHGIAYATLIAVQINRIVEDLTREAEQAV